MELRPMQQGDLLDVLAIESAVNSFPWSLAQFSSSLIDKDEASVLVTGRDIIGFIIFKHVLDESTLLNIVVHPDYQGKGYGRQMLERELLRQGREGLTRCFLEVRVSNSKAQRLYRSLGFVSVGERKNYYPAHQGRESALVMSRDSFGEAI